MPGTSLLWLTTAPLTKQPLARKIWACALSVRETKAKVLPYKPACLPLMLLFAPSPTQTAPALSKTLTNSCALLLLKLPSLLENGRKTHKVCCVRSDIAGCISLPKRYSPLALLIRSAALRRLLPKQQKHCFNRCKIRALVSTLKYCGTLASAAGKLGSCP